MGSRQTRGRVEQFLRQIDQAYDGKSWQNFTKKEGLLEDNVYALAVTPKGEIWAGTRRGVTRIAR